jgi:hypothetical protein
MALDSGSQTDVTSDNKRTYVNFYNPQHPDTNVEPGDAEAGYFEAMEWAKDAINRKELVGELVRGSMLARLGALDEETGERVPDATDLLQSVAVIIPETGSLEDLRDLLDEIIEEQSNEDDE